MVVMTDRPNWNDDRLDEGFKQIRQDNAELRAEIRQDNAALRAEMRQGNAELRAEMRQLRADMKADFAAVHTRCDRLDDRSAALQRTLLQVGGGLIGTTVVAGVGLIATQL